MYVSEKLEAGTVFVNTYNKTDVAAPFGGVKQSGFGKDLGMLCFSLHAPFVCLSQGSLFDVSCKTLVLFGRTYPERELDLSLYGY